MHEEQIKFNGKSLMVLISSDADSSVFREIFVERDYRILEPMVAKASASIFDIGAHKGFFSLYVRALNPKVTVFAFEPEVKNFAAMKENLKGNHVEGVVCKNLAVVGNSSGARVLYLSEDSHNHSLITPGGEIQDNSKITQGNRETGTLKSEPQNKTQTVQTTSLERIFEKYHLEKVSLIKMDCEGAEFEILENLPASVVRKVEVFYIEYHEYKEEMRGARLADLLRKFGFKVKIRPSHYDKRMGFILAKC